MLPVHGWKVGGEVWARYYDMASGGYVVRLHGRVLRVGRDGFALLREKPDHKGRVIDRYPHSVDMWATKEEADVSIGAHPFASPTIVR